MQKIKNYSVSLDIIRIFAAFFVVFSHSTDMFVLWPTLAGSASWYFIYYLNTLSRVAVPLFVILSGYLILDKTKTENIKTFYKRRFSRILLPFLIWLIIYYLWEAYWNQTKLSLQYIGQTLWTASIWHLYFLIVILELYLLAPFLVRFCVNTTRKMQTFFFGVFIIASIFCAIIANLPMWHFNFERNMLTIFIPYISYFFAGAYFKGIKISKLQAIVLGLIYLLFGIVTNTIAKGNDATFIIFNYSPTLFIMSIAFFLGLKNVHEYAPTFFKGKLTQNILFISSTTFGIYLLHFLVLDLVRKYFHLYPWELHAPLFLYALIPSILTFSITCALVILGRKIPFVRSIFG